MGCSYIRRLGLNRNGYHWDLGSGWHKKWVMDFTFTGNYIVDERWTLGQYKLWWAPHPVISWPWTQPFQGGVGVQSQMLQWGTDNQRVLQEPISLLCSVYAVYVPLVIVPLLCEVSLFSRSFAENRIYRTGLIQSHCELMLDDHLPKFIDSNDCFVYAGWFWR